MHFRQPSGVREHLPHLRPDGGLDLRADEPADQDNQAQADTDSYATSVAKVFTAGDMRRGQSLVVWAIREGRQCAHAVDAFLTGASTLPR